VEDLQANEDIERPLIRRQLQVTGEVWPLKNQLFSRFGSESTELRGSFLFVRMHKDRK